jgi:alpha-L-rhamnosidase
MSLKSNVLPFAALVSASFVNKPGKSFKLNISIPANTSANVYIPVQLKAKQLTLNRKKITYKKVNGFLLVEDVGSGEKVFELK